MGEREREQTSGGDCRSVVSLGYFISGCTEKNTFSLEWLPV